MASPKLRFLNKAEGEGSDGDNLVVIKRTKYQPGKIAQFVHRCLKRIRLLRGGLGSGKTRCGCEHINALALAYPGSLHLIARKDITSLKVTTQKEFLEKVVSPETIETFNVNENILYYKNGSAILFRETKDPDKVLSLELTSAMIDEATENESREIVDKLEGRLRQKINMDGEEVAPPYCLLLVFNPPGKNHWLYELSQETELVEDIQFSTYDNAHNLPDDYIPSREKKFEKAPWEKKRLLDGEWGIEVNGKPVIYGFSEENNVRRLRLLPGLPLIRSWDFGYTHPCLKLQQYDPVYDRFLVFRELLGQKIKLNLFAPQAIALTNNFALGHPVVDWCDPHGADEKDLAESSVEYLRIHHNIHCNYMRQRIKPGIEEIQERVVTKAKISEDSADKDILEAKFLVDVSCTITIAAYIYGYHQDEFGVPVKDGYFDHVVDVDRYGIVGTRNSGLARRHAQMQRRPKNRITGY